MTNWRDRYEDLKIGENYWYWHIERNIRKPTWYAVRVMRLTSIQDGYNIHSPHGPYQDVFISVSEYFPNGPRCMNPEEIEKLLSPKEEVELPNTEVYQELEDSIVECKTPTPMPEWLEKQLDIVSDTISQWSEEKKKDFLGLTKEDQKEIFEFAMKRSDEILRG